MEKYLMKICKTASKYAKNKVDKLYIYCTRRKEMYLTTVFLKEMGK